MGHGKIRRKLDRAKATRGSLSPEMLSTNISRNMANSYLDPKDFDGPGWECLAIGEADAGRFYKGENHE